MSLFLTLVKQTLQSDQNEMRIIFINCFEHSINTMDCTHLIKYHLFLIKHGGSLLCCSGTAYGWEQKSLTLLKNKT